MMVIFIANEYTRYHILTSLCYTSFKYKFFLYAYFKLRRVNYYVDRYLLLKSIITMIAEKIPFNETEYVFLLGKLKLGVFLSQVVGFLINMLTK